MHSGIVDSQLRLRPFRYADLEAVTPREDFAAEMFCLSPAEKVGLALDYGVTLERGPDLHPRLVLACGGVRELRPRIWGLWCYAGALKAREWAAVARAARSLCALVEGLGARRIEMQCDEAEAAAGRFAAALGFRATDRLIGRPCGLYRLFVRERR